MGDLAAAYVISRVSPNLLEQCDVPPARHPFSPIPIHLAVELSLPDEAIHSTVASVSALGI